MKYKVLLVDGGAGPARDLSALAAHVDAPAIERATIAAVPRHLAANTFDAIIVHSDLSTVASYASLNELAAEAGDTPVFLISDRGDDSEMRAALRAGVADVFFGDDIDRLTPETLSHAIKHAHAQRAAAAHNNAAVAMTSELSARTGAYAAAIHLLSEDGTTLHEFASVGYEPDLIRRFKIVPLSAPVPLAETVRTGVPLFMDNEAWELNFKLARSERLSKSRAWVAAPLRVGNKLIGGLVLSYDMPQPFAPGDRELILRIANEVAHRIDNCKRAMGDSAQTHDLLELAEREHQLRMVLDTTPDCIKLIDCDGIILQMNRSGQELLERDERDVVGHSVFEFIAPAHHEQFRSCLRGAFDGDAVDCEFEIVTSSGDRRLVESRMVALRGTNGEITETLAITRDVTADRQARAALAESERHFRNLVENLSDAVLVVDQNATILYINRMSVSVLGYVPAEMIGRAGWLFVHPDDLPALRMALAERLAGNESPTFSEVRMRHRDGTWRVLQLRARRSESGALGEGTVLITVRDVTETRKTEMDLQQTREQLLQAQKLDAIGRLAGGIAHDFNNLLTAIGGHTDLIIDGLDPNDQMHRDLLEIRVAVDRAATLTRQLLAFSRKQVLQPTVINLSELVEDTHSMLRRLIGEGIAIELSLPREPALIKADSTQMQQVLVNLAVNARDAMPRGGRITIAVGPDNHRDTSCIRLRVSDTGTGMSAEVQERIFEPFFTTKEQGKGTGLGLPTVYGIVQQSGGHIEVSSEIGVGTTFDVYLPAVQEAAHTEPKAAPEIMHQKGRETILLVEDEPSVREVTARMLRRGGYSVLEVERPDEAIAVAREAHHSINMVVTDVGLPGITGPEMVEHLLTIRPDFKVLFTSGYANDEIFAEGRTASRYAFLEKPFTARALLDSVRSVLDN